MFGVVFLHNAKQGRLLCVVSTPKSLLHRRTAHRFTMILRFTKSLRPGESLISSPRHLFFVGNFVESFRFWAILDPRAFLRMTNKEEELRGTLEQVRLSPSDWFQQKTIKVFLTGPLKFARERVDVRRVWRVSGFFLRNVEVDTPGRLLISAIPKQHLHN